MAIGRCRDGRGRARRNLLGDIPDEYGLDLRQLSEEVQQIGHISSFMAYLDESFLAAEHGPDGVNAIDDLLQRRDWKESPRAREYLQGIRATAPTLWEVHDVKPGEWIETRDRLREVPVRRSWSRRRAVPCSAGTFRRPHR